MQLAVAVAVAVASGVAWNRVGSQECGVRQKCIVLNGSEQS